MPQRKGVAAPQNKFLDTIATRFDGTHANFVLGNAQGANNQIVYCSDGFCRLTRQSRSYIMGQMCWCDFMWRGGTEMTKRDAIMEVLREKRELKIYVVLYTSDDEPFICLMDILPIKNEKGEVVLFLVSFKDVSAEDIEDETTVSIFENEWRAKAEHREVRPSTTSVVSEMATPSLRRKSRAVLVDLQLRMQAKPAKTSKSYTDRTTPPPPLFTRPDSSRNSRCTVIVHYRVWKILWDWAVLLSTFYIAVIVPYNAAFYRRSTRGSLRIVDLGTELLFLADVFLNFFTTYISPEGILISDHKQIATRYLKSWFILDMAAAVPFDTVILFQEHFLDTDAWSTQNSKIYLIKLTRLIRLVRMFHKVERYSRISWMILGFLTLMFGLLAHWFACVWYVIGLREMTNNGTRSSNWLHELGTRLNHPYDSSISLSTAYVSSLYYACSSLTSVGFGNVSANTNSEKIFSIIMMLIGALMHAAVFGNVAAIIQRIYARRATYQTKSRELKEFLRSQGVTKTLRRKVQESFQTNWSLTRGIDKSTVLSDVRESIQGEVAFHMYNEFMSCGLFKDASPAFAQAVALQLRTVCYTPDEMIVQIGDAVKHVYFIETGTLEFSRGEIPVAFLQKNNMFGIDLQYDGSAVNSMCDVKPMTYCVLNCIRVDMLRRILQDYQTYSDDFLQQLSETLLFNFREDADKQIQETSEIELCSKLAKIEENEEQSVGDILPPWDIRRNSDSTVGRSCDERSNSVSSSAKSGDFQERYAISYNQLHRRKSYESNRKSASQNRRSSESSVEVSALRSELSAVRDNMARMEASVGKIGDNVRRLTDNMSVLMAAVTRHHAETSCNCGGGGDSGSGSGTSLLMLPNVGGGCCWRTSATAAMCVQSPSDTDDSQKTTVDCGGGGGGVSNSAPNSMLATRRLRPPPSRIDLKQHHLHPNNGGVGDQPGSAVSANSIRDLRYSPHSVSSGFLSNQEESPKSTTKTIFRTPPTSLAATETTAAAAVAKLAAEFNERRDDDPYRRDNDSSAECNSVSSESFMTELAISEDESLLLMSTAPLCSLIDRNM